MIHTMVDLIDPTLRSSNAYRARKKIAYTVSVKYIFLILAFICICFSIFVITQSTLDTTAQDTIKVNPTLKKEPGSESPTGRIPSIPKTPQQN